MRHSGVMIGGLGQGRCDDDDCWCRKKEKKRASRQPDWKRVADSYREDLAALILIGNRLARGEATREEWHEAVRQATLAEGPICVRIEKRGGPGSDDPHPFRR